jgi:hypothetical protein
LAGKGVTDAKPKAIRDLAGGVIAALRLHAGKSVQIVGDGMPARWKVT